ncbi:ribose-phosphate pyrophosphokinase [Mycoplasmatota bacterium]|nr:ribose-phosphate pyrophosphokinase [Mycoplasmatota bacterium]
MAVLYGKKIKLFSLGSNNELAAEISEYIDVPLSSISVKEFADGEVNINIEETVREHDVFIVQSTNEPVNDNYMKLLITIDALKRASARNINVIMPYYGYSRQDRKAKSRQPISAKLIADLIQVAGATRVLTMDLHASQIQGFFDIPIDNLVAFPSIADYFESMNFKDSVVVSPDHGGATRARQLADALSVPIAIIDKSRPLPNVAEVMGIIGDVENKTCIIIDDMIDTAGTLTVAASALMEHGAKEVYASCTHPIFSGPAIDRINNSVLKEVVVTNTIQLSENKKTRKVKQLSVSDLFGQAVLNIINGEPLSGLFERRH